MPRFAVVLGTYSTGVRYGYWITPKSPDPCATTYQVAGNPQALAGTNWTKVCEPVTVEQIKTTGRAPPTYADGILYEVS